MRTIATTCCWFMLIATYCSAQMSVNPDGRDRNGLTVRSSQTVSVSANFLRGFVTLDSVDAEPRNAIANVSAKKKAAFDALKTIGVPEKSIKTTSTRILQWYDAKPKILINYSSSTNALVLTTDSHEYSAVADLSFDIPLAGLDPDELSILSYDACKRLKKQSVFESSKFFFLYVGELTESQIKDATKKAYSEALANAESIAEVSGRSLGKLAAITPEIDGRWRYWSQLTYGYWNDYSTSAEENPLAKFSPAENEVFGSDASKLSRTYSVELRFSVE